MEELFNPSVTEQLVVAARIVHQKANPERTASGVPCITVLGNVSVDAGLGTLTVAFARSRSGGV